MADRMMADERPAIELRLKDGDGQRAQFEVLGIPRNELVHIAKRDLSADEWIRLLSVTLVRPGMADLPPLVGTHGSDGERVWFRPRYPLEPGQTYRVHWDGLKASGREVPSGVSFERDFVLPKRASAPVTVSAIYPTSDQLPENHLKFYLHFSAAMSRGEAYRRVHLLVEGGQEVAAPFLELGEELWDPSGTRFTLYFDPGRIKRGLQPREELGPALEEGKRYTLMIDRDWCDAQGNPLAAPARKQFSVRAPDEVQPNTSRWKVRPAAAGSREPIQVDFDEPLDHALLERMLSVRRVARETPGKDTPERALANSGQDSVVIDGSIKISSGERRWTFAPKQPWTPGRYELVVDTALEDLAGNSVGRPFEIDVLRPDPQGADSETVTVPFEVRP